MGWWGSTRRARSQLADERLLSRDQDWALYMLAQAPWREGSLGDNTPSPVLQATLQEHSDGYGPNQAGRPQRGKSGEAGCAELLDSVPDSLLDTVSCQPLFMYSQWSD